MQMSRCIFVVCLISLGVLGCKPENKSVKATAPVTVTVLNDDTHDLYVTILDLNTANQDVIWKDHRLNNHDKEDIAVTPDGDGNSHVHWAARRVDDNKCGDKDEAPGENPLKVYASSECPTTSRPPQH